MRRRRGVRLVALATAVAAGLSLAVVPAGWADTGGDKKQVDSRIAALRSTLEGTSASLSRAVEQLSRTRALLPAAREGVAVATAAQVAAQRRNMALARALRVARVREAQAKAVLVKNAIDTQAVQDQVGNLVRSDYQEGGVSGLALVLEATSAQDLSDRIMMMDTVMSVRRGSLSDLGVLRVQGQVALAHMVAVRRQVVSLKAQAQVAVAHAVLARRAAAAAKGRLDRLYAAQARYQGAVAAKKAAELSRLGSLQAQSAALASQLAARPMPAPTLPARASRAPLPEGRGTGFLSYPDSASVGSVFGMRYDPYLHVWALHAGLDLEVGCGTPVHAAADGNVIMATPASASGGYGNQLVIDHGYQRGSDLTTTYNHLSSFVVTSGHVSRGQVIAYSGTTGFSTGCHLHFETRQNGVPVNPYLWL